MVSVAMQALHELGVANPARNFIVVSEGDLTEDGIPVVVLAKKSAFTPAEEESGSRRTSTTTVWPRSICLPRRETIHSPR